MDLTSFELAVYRRDRDTAWRLLFPILWELASQPIHDGALAANTWEERKTLFTRLAAAIAALLADPETTLSDALYRQLLVVGNVTSNVFTASDFGSSDHALRCMGLLPGSGQTQRITPQFAAKLHTVYSLDSAASVDLAGLAKKPPSLRLLLFLKYLSTKPVLSLAGHQRREQLLDMADQLEPAPLPDTADNLVQASNAYMLCSYAEHPRKHAVKPVIAASVREWMLRRGLTDARLPATRQLRARPTMLVASEYMLSGHVQYRYFGQWLRQLAKRFRLVLVTEDGQVDGTSRRLFDDVRTFSRSPNGAHLAEAVSLIKALSPDIIFYPSVGMKHWGVALSTLRLAPIQLTALGHSASTFCPEIDYYVIEQGYVSDPALLSERVVLLPDESLRFERFPGFVAPAPDIRERPGTLRIALPSNLLKLNPAFLSTCRQISDASGRPLEFHAFPNARALEGDVASAALRRWLPNAVVHPFLGYPEYLAALNACDLVLSPSPFGGLHSVVDSLRQGLPVIARDCPEPHGRTDSMILRLAGMPEASVVQSERHYIDRALQVIGDDELRVAWSRHALAAEVDRRLFGDASTPLRSEVIDAVSWLYENHESIMADGRKAWEPSVWSGGAALRRSARSAAGTVSAHSGA